VEDQQPAAGDLTDEARDEPEAADSQAETVEAAAPVTETDAAEGDSPEEDGADSEAAPAEDAETAATEAAPVKQEKQKKQKKPKKQRKRRPGRVAAVVIALVAALFVGSSAFAAAMVQPYLAERATIEVKVKVARAAANAITTLWSYTPENMDTLADRAGRYLTGDFGAQYRKFVEEKVVGPNKQLKITNSTEVTGVAVESLEGPNATVIVYTNTTATTPLKKNIPSLQYLSYRMSMKREGDRWLVTRMTTITSLDVTPQL